MNIIRERGRGRARGDIEIRPRGDVGAPWGAPHHLGTQTGARLVTGRLGVSRSSPRKRALSRTCPRGHGRVPFGSGRVPGCHRTGPGTMSECGAGTGVPAPIPSTAHMCEARSGWEKASTGPGPDWSVAYTLGPLSDTPRLQPSTVRCIGVLFVCGSAALSKQQLVF